MMIEMSPPSPWSAIRRASSLADKALGMDQSIDRRDFLNGFALSIGAGLIGTRPGVASAADVWPQDQPGYYLSLLEGLRGSHPGSFENAHAPSRDGTSGTHSAIKNRASAMTWLWSAVGSAAFRRRISIAPPPARRDAPDFGQSRRLWGHAKRNEFHLGGKLHLLNGGTLEIDSPRPYSLVARWLARDLGIDPVALAEACDRDNLYPSLGLSLGRSSSTGRPLVKTA